MALKAWKTGPSISKKTTFKIGRVPTVMKKISGRKLEAISVDGGTTTNYYPLSGGMPLFTIRHSPFSGYMVTQVAYGTDFKPDTFPDRKGAEEWAMFEYRRYAKEAKQTPRGITCKHAPKQHPSGAEAWARAHGLDYRKKNPRSKTWR